MLYQKAIIIKGSRRGLEFWVKISSPDFRDFVYEIDKNGNRTKVKENVLTYETNILLPNGRNGVATKELVELLASFEEDIQQIKFEDWIVNKE